MITDPPYGVDYDAAWREEMERRRENRDLKQSEIAGMRNRHAVNLAAVRNDDRISWGAAFQLAPAGIAYVWHAAQYTAELTRDLASAGFEIQNRIVWCKPNFAISRGHYHWQHEPVAFALRAGQASNWIGDRSQTTVWEIASMQPMGRSQDENDRATGHGTQKPLECMARPLRNHAGEVYDPFVGSGTTLVAAENLKRRCYALEIDPGCVAVALERMATAFPKLKIAKVGP
jgi:DNA modification methylase